MPCYTPPVPTESQVIYQRIIEALTTNKELGCKYIKELVKEYVALHSERNKMGNILCDLGSQVRDNACRDIFPCADFFVWHEDHLKRDAEKDNQSPPPGSLFYFESNYIEMGR